MTGTPLVADQETLRKIMLETLSDQYHDAQYAIDDVDIPTLLHIARKFQNRIKSELESFGLELLPEEQ